jgi:hypothetical protein
MILFSAASASRSGTWFWFATSAVGTADVSRTYHDRKFASQKQNYWSRDQQGHSEWQGTLAQQWKVAGSVDAEHFAHLSEA